MLTARSSSPRRLAVALALGLLAALPACNRAGQGTPRTIVLVTLDTCRADALGPWHEGESRTPTVDRLAAEGTVFENTFAVAPLTLPSHASIFTGRHPDEHGAWNNGTYVLPPEEITLTEVLAEAGWRTGAIAGAMVMNRLSGIDQGFEHYVDVTLENSHQQRMPLERKAGPVVADALAWAAGWKARDRAFLWVHLYDAHAPYEPAEGEPTAATSRLAYEGEVASADRAVGELLSSLKAAGRLDDALVIITADHGESFGAHGEMTHGYFIHEGVLHVPLILWAPGRVPAGLRVKDSVSLVDIAPTVLQLAGAVVPPRTSGRDLAPLMKGQPLPPGPAYAASMLPWLQVGACPQRSVRADGWKLIDGPRPELYHLAADPAELKNLANSADHRERLASLRVTLASTRAAMQKGVDARRGLSEEEQEKLRALLYFAGPKDRDASDEGACEKDAKETYVLQHLLVRQVFAGLHGRDEEVVTLLGAMVDENPTLHDARLALAGELRAAGRLEEAAHHYEKVIGLAATDSPSHVAAAYVGLADLGASFGHEADAVGMLQDALKADPDYVPAWKLLAKLLAAMPGREAEASEALARAHALDPTDGDEAAAPGPH